ncbi:MAG: nucleotidyltransferase domain-containing protein, partial [Alcanivoracaceae bacterium]|nr:nucleotidyltransferase domain-containing protein [Alcanivoracaceae bacterium]
IMLENNDLDFSGWDLRKCLRLLMKSNAALLERIQSPIIYQADTSFLNEIMAIATPCYSRRATLHHYLGLAKRSYSDIIDNKQYKLKKFFYALRAATACRWIITKDKMPPIEFQNMLYVLNIDESIIKRIESLIELKATISESYLHEGDGEILEFINDNIIHARKQAGDLPVAICDIEKLNTFFIKSLP